jgi:hypothetical protein
MKIFVDSEMLFTITENWVLYKTLFPRAQTRQLSIWNNLGGQFSTYAVLTYNFKRDSACHCTTAFGSIIGTVIGCFPFS